MELTPTAAATAAATTTTSPTTTGVIPIPGLPHGPTNPFAYSVLGSAALHLAAQTLVFGAAAVLVDVGLMQLVRRLWARLLPGSSGQHHPRPHSHEAGDEIGRAHV